MTEMSRYKSIKLAGRLDTTRVGEIETGFYAQIGALKNKDEIVLIDLSEVSFLSSLGIRLLVTAGKTFSQRGLQFGIVEPKSADVMEALEISGLTGLFRFFGSEEEARAAF
jgi:anti-anti-sigma factor